MERKVNAAQKETGGRIDLICVDCRYRFKMRPDAATNVRCPYCGKNKLMRNETTAQQLIEEASKIIDQERTMGYTRQ